MYQQVGEIEIMGRHTVMLSDDWSTCTKCNQKLEHGVCMCCGAGTKGICTFCMKQKSKKGKDLGWRIGDNKGCDEHLQKGDVKFPMEFNCIHVSCNDCGKALDGRYCIRMIFENEPLCDKCVKKNNKKYLKPKPKIPQSERLVIP